MIMRSKEMYGEEEASYFSPQVDLFLAFVTPLLISHPVVLPSTSSQTSDKRGSIFGPWSFLFLLKPNFAHNLALTLTLVCHHRRGDGVRESVIRGAPLSAIPVNGGMWAS